MRLVVLFFLGLLACGEKESDDSGTDDSGTDSVPQTLEIVGEYIDSWDGSHTITETAWLTGTSAWAIASYDNEAEFLVAQNDAANTYFPGEWSRMDWTWSGSDLYYCQIAYEADSQADAEGTTTANRADLGGGCGGFGWTQLTAAR